MLILLKLGNIYFWSKIIILGNCIYFRMTDNKSDNKSRLIFDDFSRTAQHIFDIFIDSESARQVLSNGV